MEKMGGRQPEEAELGMIMNHISSFHLTNNYPKTDSLITLKCIETAAPYDICKALSNCGNGMESVQKFYVICMGQFRIKCMNDNLKPSLKTRTGKRLYALFRSSLTMDQLVEAFEYKRKKNRPLKKLITRKEDDEDDEEEDAQEEIFLIKEHFEVLLREIFSSVKRGPSWLKQSTSPYYLNLSFLSEIVSHAEKGLSVRAATQMMNHVSTFVDSPSQDEYQTEHETTPTSQSTTYNPSLEASKAVTLKQLPDSPSTTQLNRGVGAKQREEEELRSKIKRAEDYLECDDEDKASDKKIFKDNDVAYYEALKYTIKENRRYIDSGGLEVDYKVDDDYEKSL